jgi:hypothetical protein
MVTQATLHLSTYQLRPHPRETDLYWDNWKPQKQCHKHMLITKSTASKPEWGSVDGTRGGEDFSACGTCAQMDTAWAASQPSLCDGLREGSGDISRCWKHCSHTSSWLIFISRLVDGMKHGFQTLQELEEAPTDWYLLWNCYSYHFFFIIWISNMYKNGEKCLMKPHVPTYHPVSKINIAYLDDVNPFHDIWRQQSEFI